MRSSDVVSIAFVVPLQGPTGIYGPSCLACGQLAETTPTTFSEEVVWTKAHPGRYRVGVDFSDTCGRGEGEVGFRVIADAGGRRREAVGTLAPARFAPVVLEFDVLPTPERGAAGNSTKDGP